MLLVGQHAVDHLLLVAEGRQVYLGGGRGAQGFLHPGQQGGGGGRISRHQGVVTPVCCGCYDRRRGGLGGQPQSKRCHHHPDQTHADQTQAEQHRAEGKGPHVSRRLTDSAWLWSPSLSARVITA